MKEQTSRIFYWVVTIPFAALILFAAFNYFFKHALIVDVFTRLGFPAYIIYPLAVAKVLGLAALLSNYSKTLKEWAYAGFFFNLVLALSAHINAGDGQWTPAAVCLVLLTASYVLDRQVHGGVKGNGN